MSPLKKINERQYLIYKETRGKDAIVDEILDNPEGPIGQLYKTVSEFHVDKLRRSYLEACLLASQDFDRIADLLEMDKDVIKMYYDIYYSVDGSVVADYADTLTANNDNLQDMIFGQPNFQNQIISRSTFDRDPLQPQRLEFYQQ